MKLLGVVVLCKSCFYLDWLTIFIHDDSSLKYRSIKATASSLVETVCHILDPFISIEIVISVIMWFLLWYNCLKTGGANVNWFKDYFSPIISLVFSSFAFFFTLKTKEIKIRNQNRLFR